MIWLRCSAAAVHIAIPCVAHTGSTESVVNSGVCAVRSPNVKKQAIADILERQIEVGRQMHAADLIALLMEFPVRCFLLARPYT